MNCLYRIFRCVQVNKRCASLQETSEAKVKQLSEAVAAANNQKTDLEKKVSRTQISSQWKLPW
jgi:hypothetical protein